MIGRKLGDYFILQKLGSGVFGKVYLAEHQFIKKKYALKVLPDDLVSNPGFIEKFQNEVAILASLEHPSIVKLHNISSAGGKYFLIMDAIVDDAGAPMSLDRYLNSAGAAIQESELRNVLLQVASAIDYAHRVEFKDGFLAHRGLKFSNIFVNDTEEMPRVFVSDFGLTGLVGEGSVLLKHYEHLLGRLIPAKTGEPNQDSTGLSMNFSFFSPEQKVLGSKVDYKSDIYAFGVLAYFLIARTFPEGYFDLPSKISPEYRLNWDLLICQCLQKDPKKRPEVLTDAMDMFLKPVKRENNEVFVLSWEEVGKKVENAMQMSFEFSTDEIAAGEEMDAPPKYETDPGSEHKPIIRPCKIARPEYDSDPAAIFQKELNVSYYQPKKVEVKNVQPIQTEMVIIPAGCYERGSESGSRDEQPRHKVTLSGFALDIHPVTNEQFVRFLSSMGGDKDSANNDIIRLRDSRVKRMVGKLTIESGYARHPVVGVTWYGAFAYAQWVGKRLPTEVEWEIAAGGGEENGLFPTGVDIDHSEANFFSSDTTAVTSYPPNGFGLYDMAGNVYEWCQDWYAYNYYDSSQQDPENPKGPSQGVYRVLRGGCWKSLKEDLRCAHRHRNNPGAVNGTYGFRCAADVS